MSTEQPDESSFLRHLMGQFPLRPTHPDFERLTEIVNKIEIWKAAGVKGSQAYADIVDVVSASYMAANRSGAHDAAHPEMTMVEAMSNAWVEGLLFGVLFECAGGTRPETD